jgi:hypothetical protein
VEWGLQGESTGCPLLLIYPFSSFSEWITIVSVFIHEAIRPCAVVAGTLRIEPRTQELHFVGTRSSFVLFCIVFCCNKTCNFIFGEDADREEEQLWFELNFVSFDWESRRPLCFCASQLLHVIRFLALLEQALPASHINRWFPEWNRAMRSLIFLWFVCTSYLFWLFFSVQIWISSVLEVLWRCWN